MTYGQYSIYSKKLILKQVQTLKTLESYFFHYIQPPPENVLQLTIFIFVCSVLLVYSPSYGILFVSFYLHVFPDIFAVCDLCHSRATCEQQGQLQYGCECVGGFEGDGMTCTGEKSTVFDHFYYEN